MTQKERLIISAYTGYAMTEFWRLQEFAGEVLGRKIATHELVEEGIREELRERVKPDFIKLCDKRCVKK